MMAIWLSGVQLGLKPYPWFQTSLIWNHKYDFRPNNVLHSVQLPLYYLHFKTTPKYMILVNTISLLIK